MDEHVQSALKYSALDESDQEWISDDFMTLLQFVDSFKCPDCESKSEYFMPSINSESARPDEFTYEKWFSKMSNNNFCSPLPQRNIENE